MDLNDLGDAGAIMHNQNRQDLARLLANMIDDVVELGPVGFAKFGEESILRLQAEGREFESKVMQYGCGMIAHQMAIMSQIQQEERGL